jgi:hypothetical protein
MNNFTREIGYGNTSMKKSDKPSSNKAQPLGREAEQFHSYWVRTGGVRQIVGAAWMFRPGTYRAADVSSIAILAIDARIGLVEVDVVEDVEGLCSQLERRRSVKLNDLATERSALKRPGPVSQSRPELPNVPVAGRAYAPNAFGLPPPST